MKKYVLIGFSVLFLAGCRTTKQVQVQHVEKVTEMAHSHQSETRKTDSSATDYNCIEEITIIETVDTIVRVFPILESARPACPSISR